jgi:two-component system LytT family response regulator
MPNLNGFELLDRIEYRKFHLIFTTAHEEFALRAIKQNALDYLLKPIDGEDLKAAIVKVIKSHQENDSVAKALALINAIRETEELKISVPGKDGVEIVQAKDVMYIEANSNQSVVVLKGKQKHQVKRSLKDFENQLCVKESSFIRIHNSFIINVNHVTRYLPEDGGYAVVGEKTVPISKVKKEEFLSKINFGMR